MFGSSVLFPLTTAAATTGNGGGGGGGGGKISRYRKKRKKTLTAGEAIADEIKSLQYKAIEGYFVSMAATGTVRISYPSYIDDTIFSLSLSLLLKV